MGVGAGAPNGVGVGALPKGEAEDKPPVVPNGLLVLAPDAEFPNGDGAEAEELPNGVKFVCEFEDVNGDGAGV